MFRALLADPAIPLSTRCDATGSLGELTPVGKDEAVQILRELAADPQARADDLLEAAHALVSGLFICTQDHDQWQRSLRGFGCHGA